MVQLDSKYNLREYFPSNLNGAKIINAISGISYPDYVGSKEEAKYFR